MPKELFEEIHSLMLKHRFKPNFDYSQNFMIDSKLLELIVFHANLKKTDVVLEIGPGVGFLTELLVKKCLVKAIEADPRMISILNERINSKNLELIEDDFLSSDLPQFNKVVSLPPYSISSKIISKILLTGFESAYLVFQKEFVAKLTAIPGFNEYCATTVVVNYYCEPKIIIENIKPDSFFPKPKSFSSFLELKNCKRFGKVKNEKLFGEFLNCIFRYKNKNLRNALTNSYQILSKKIALDKTEFVKKIDSLEIAGEKINLIETKDYVELFNELF